AIYSGVTTNHLAALVGDLVANHRDLRGLYQVASEPISKYDLLLLLREVFVADVTIVRDESFVCDRSMRGERLRSKIGYVAPPWRDLALELVHDKTPYERLK